MGSEDYYLELCERPVQFEKANPVNCVFFDEANKQVSGGRGEGPAPRRLSVAAPAPRVPGVSYRSRESVRGHGRCQCASWLSEGQSLGLACSCMVLKFV